MNAAAAAAAANDAALQSLEKPEKQQPSRYKSENAVDVSVSLPAVVAEAVPPIPSERTMSSSPPSPPSYSSSSSSS